MYRILLVKQGFPQGTYEFYKKTVTTIEDDIETISLVVFETDDLTELSNKYTDLMKDHPTDNIIPIQVLDTEILVTIEDNLGNSNS